MPICHELRFRDDELEPGGLKLLGVKESPLGQDAAVVLFYYPATAYHVLPMITISITTTSITITMTVTITTTIPFTITMTITVTVTITFVIPHITVWGFCFYAALRH